MSEIWNQIYDLAYPIIVMCLLSLGTAIIAWASISIPKSAWYQRQPWVVRKGIDLALKISIAKFQPEAERLKQVYGGTLPTHEAEMLKMAAVQDAMETIKLEHPKIDAVVPARVLETKIAARVAPVLKVVKKERARMRNRGHG